MQWCTGRCNQEGVDCPSEIDAWTACCVPAGQEIPGQCSDSTFPGLDLCSDQCAAQVGCGDIDVPGGLEENTDNVDFTCSCAGCGGCSGITQTPTVFVPGNAECEKLVDEHWCTGKCTTPGVECPSDIDQWTACCVPEGTTLPDVDPNVDLYVPKAGECSIRYSSSWCTAVCNSEGNVCPGGADQECCIKASDRPELPFEPVVMPARMKPAVKVYEAEILSLGLGPVGDVFGSVTIFEIPLPETSDPCVYCVETVGCFFGGYGFHPPQANGEWDSETCEAITTDGRTCRAIRNECLDRCPGAESPTECLNELRLNELAPGDGHLNAYFVQATLDDDYIGVYQGAAQGMHVHSGTACVDADNNPNSTLQGGHYMDTEEADYDPWASFNAEPGEGGLFSFETDATAAGYVIAGKPFVVHAPGSERIGCGILRSVEPKYYNAPITPIDVHDAIKDVSGEVTIIAGTNSMLNYGHVATKDGSALGSASSGGGLHVHSGFGCETNGQQGGHYDSVSVTGAPGSMPTGTAADPWTTKLGSLVGDATAASFAHPVTVGTDYIDVAGHAYVYHDYDSGNRASCGILSECVFEDKFCLPTTGLLAHLCPLVVPGGGSEYCNDGVRTVASACCVECPATV